MEKRTKIKLIANISRSIAGLKPITESSDYPKYVMLTNRFENFKRWPETSKISRREFEMALHNDPDLVDAYLDIFSTEADFYLCMVSYNSTTYHYCIMCRENKIVMLYYRKVFVEIV